MNVVGFVLLAIIVVNVGIFLYTTGFFSHPADFSLIPKTINPPDSTYGDKVVAGQSGSTVSTDSATNNPIKNSIIATSDIPAGFTRDQLSPFFHKIRFREVTPGARDQVEAVRLIGATNSTEKVNVTGFVLQANRGAQVIPQAIGLLDILHPTLESDIAVGNGDVVSVYASTNVIGSNIRLNRCSGYLQNHYGIQPEIARECPAVPRADIVTFTGACQDYLLSLKSCQEPSIGNIPPQDTLCRYYANNMNYLGCVDRYKNSPGFYLGQWSVWTGNNFLDDFHDRLLLLDRAGKLVDVYIY